MNRPVESDYTSLTAYTRALEAYCDSLQPEQKPVALYVYKLTLPRGHLGNVSDGDLPWVYDQDPSSGYSARMLVYTTPPQRTWVDLTDEERKEIWWSCEQQTPTTFVKAIEQALKEKNT